MSYDLQTRILNENQRYHRRAEEETARYHETTVREQARMRNFMEMQARIQDEHLRREGLASRIAQVVQQIIEECQGTINRGKERLQEGAYPAAIQEFNAAVDEYNHQKKELKDQESFFDDVRDDAIKHGLRSLKRQWEAISPELYRHRGLAYLLNHDFDDAKEDFTESVEADSTDYESYNLRARAMMCKAKRDHKPFPKSVLKDLNKSLQLSSHQEATIARRFFVQGDMNHAIFHLERVVAQRDLPVHERVELSELLGDAYRQTGQKELALEAFENTIENTPDQHQHFEQLEILFTKKGDILLELGREEEAIAAYQQAHEKNEDNPLCFLHEAEGGEAERQYQIAKAYYEGSAAIKQDWAKASEWLQRCARRKNEAYLTLGRIYDDGGFGVDRDPAAAVSFYRKSRDGDAQYNAGLLLRSGEEGLPANPREAVKCFRKAEKLGDPSCKVDASFHLGELLSKVDGVRRSFAEACRYYRAVADSELEDIDQEKKNKAAYRIGLWYHEGRKGLPEDINLAFRYLRQAYRADYEKANEPYAEVLFDCAETYDDDRKHEVLPNYKIAADLGHGMAAFRAGELYRTGAPEIPQDKEKAVKYLKMAQEQGIEEAEKSLKELDSTCCIV